MKKILLHSYSFFKLFTLALLCSFILSFKISGSWQNVNPDEAAKELILINKSMMKYERYSFNITYTSFKEHDDSKPYDTRKGNVIKDGINVYSNINHALTIQNKKLRLVVDSSKKFVKVSDPLKGIEANLNLDDYIKAMGICKAVKRKEDNSVVAYRFEPKAGKGIVAQEIYFRDNFLVKSVIYYANDHSIRENNEIITQTIYPRLEIAIMDFKPLEKVNKDIFNTDNIISISKDQIVPKDKFKTYKIFDGRFKK